MDDIVRIKLLFLAGVLAMSAVTAIVASAIARIASWRAARGGRARTGRWTGPGVEDAPARGTR